MCQPIGMRQHTAATLRTLVCLMRACICCAGGGVASATGGQAGQWAGAAKVSLAHWLTCVWCVRVRMLALCRAVAAAVDVLSQALSDAVAAATKAADARALMQLKQALAPSPPALTTTLLYLIPRPVPICPTFRSRKTSCSPPRIARRARPLSEASERPFVAMLRWCGCRRFVSCARTQYVVYVDVKMWFLIQYDSTFLRCCFSSLPDPLWIVTAPNECFKNKCPA